MNFGGGVEGVEGEGGLWWVLVGMVGGGGRKGGGGGDGGDACITRGGTDGTVVLRSCMRVCHLRGIK